MKLFANTLLDYSSADKTIHERILWFDTAEDTLVTINCCEKQTLPVLKRLTTVYNELRLGIVKILDHDPYLRVVDHETLGTRAKLLLDKAWRAIEQIVENEPYPAFDKKARAKLIQEAVEKKLGSRQSINVYLCRYWQGGKSLSALVPKFEACGAGGKDRLENAEHQKRRGRKPIRRLVFEGNYGVNIDSNLQQKILDAAKLHYEQNPGNSLRKAYDDSLGSVFATGYSIGANGVEVPILPLEEKQISFQQFYYHYKKSKRDSLAIRAREGDRAFEMNFRALLGNSTQMAFGPGSVFQVDAHVGKIHLVSAIDRKLIIGKPIIYVVKDVFSRMIVGFSVGLEGPSWRGALLAIENTVTHKPTFCDSLGIQGISEYLWPAHHLPRAFLADNGEFHGYNSDLLVNNFNVRMVNTPPYRPDWKGIIERHFRIMKERIGNWLETAVYNNRTPNQLQLEASLDLNELRKLLAICFIEHNTTTIIKDYPRPKDMIQASIKAIPLELWHWGIQNRTGLLQQYPVEMVRANLLPQGQAVITASGLLFESLFYDHPWLRGSLNWYENTRIHGRKRISISYDPMNSSSIYVHLSPRDASQIDDADVICVGNNAMLRCTVKIIRGYEANQHRDDIRLVQALEDFDRKGFESEVLQTKAEFSAQAKALLEEAKERTKAAHTANGVIQKNLPVQNITANRSIEKQLERQVYRDGINNEPQTAQLETSKINLTESKHFTNDIDNILDSLLEDGS
jgi:putative transposase